MRRPVTPSEQLESELWAACLGFCEWWQLAALLGRVEGVPNSFSGHPFHFLDHKEQVAIKKRAATRTALRKAGKGRIFYMDFGFLRSSSSDFRRPSTNTDSVVTLFDRFESYLLIVDEHTRHVWVFLTRSKDPPVKTAGAFLT